MHASLQRWGRYWRSGDYISRRKQSPCGGDMGTKGTTMEDLMGRGIRSCIWKAPGQYISSKTPASRWRHTHMHRNTEMNIKTSRGFNKTLKHNHAHALWALCSEWLVADWHAGWRHESILRDKKEERKSFVLWSNFVQTQRSRLSVLRINSIGKPEWWCLRWM